MSIVSILGLLHKIPGEPIVVRCRMVAIDGKKTGSSAATRCYFGIEQTVLDNR